MPGNALTAEHDFVIETAESAVAALLDSVVTMLPATLQLQRAEFGPDVEGQVNLLYRWPPGFGVRAVTSGWRPDRMIPDDLGLFQLTFLVYAGSLSLASPTGGRIAPLVGRLTVGPIAVQTATGEVQPPGADPDDPSAFVLVGLNASLSVVATVDLAWSDDTAARIETLLAGVQSLDRAGITALITDGIKKTLRPLAIPIVPQATPRRLRPGSYLTPTPRFTPYDGSLQSTPPLAVNFEPRSLAAANSRPGVLVNYVDILFHTFDVALHAQTQAGGFLRKTETATRTGYIGSVTIGPAAFSDLMLVPILPAALGVVPQGTTLTPEQASRFLPPALGTAESTALQQDFYLTQAAIRLAEGRIVLTGLVETGGTGYTAEASFSATMTLSLQQGVIVPNIRVDRVRVEIFIDWWVSFLAGLGLGPIGTAIEIAVRDHLEEEFSRLARSLFQSILDSALQPFNLPNTLVAYTPAVLEIHPEGVVIQYSGSLPARYQPPAVSLGLGVTTNVLDQTTGKTQTDRGALCTRDDYTYVETLQRVQITFDAALTNLIPPVQLRWTLAGQPLTAGTTTQVTTPATSGAAPQPSVALFATLSPDGTHLTVLNLFGAPNVLVTVQVDAVDAEGQHTVGIRQVPINGRVRTYEDRYYQDLEECIKSALKDMPRGGPTGDFGRADIQGLIQRHRGDPVPWEIVAHNVLGAADLRGQRLEWLGQALRHGALNLRRYQ